MGPMKTNKEALKKVPKLMVHELIQEFEEFVGALKEIEQLSGADQEKRQAFIQQANKAQNRLRAQFTQAAKAFGLTFDEFCEFIGDSNNFEPKDWETLQATKERLSKDMNSTELDKKIKKANKNLKI
jgi:hypothetical protein